MLLHTYQIFSSLRVHLHFSVHFFFTFSVKFFHYHPISMLFKHPSIRSQRSNTVPSTMTLLLCPRRGGGGGETLRAALIIGVVAAALLSMTVVEAGGCGKRRGRPCGQTSSRLDPVFIVIISGKFQCGPFLLS